MLLPKSGLQILGRLLRIFIIGVFGLIVLCTILAALGAPTAAWTILTSALPTLGRFGMCLVLAIAIGILFESL